MKRSTSLPNLSLVKSYDNEICLKRKTISYQDFSLSRPPSSNKSTRKLIITNDINFGIGKFNTEKINKETLQRCWI